MEKLIIISKSLIENNEIKHHFEEYIAAIIAIELAHCLAKHNYELLTESKGELDQIGQVPLAFPYHQHQDEEASLINR
eukprot:UN04035